jgi:hypothetical protein
MKTGDISGFPAILILGFLLTAGCSGSVSPDNTLQPAAPATATVAPAAAPVLTPGPQIVDETAFVPPATVPTTVRTTTATRYYEPAYTQYNLRPALSADGVAGTLITRVTGCSSNTLTVFIARAETNVSPVDTQYLLDRMVAGDQNPDFLPVKILPDGSSDIVQLAPGTYTAYLPDKTGDEIEEQQSFKIGANVITYISFTGSSYSTPSSSGSPCRRR